MQTIFLLQHDKWQLVMFTRGLATILLLVLSNTFMTFAWYGHLRYSGQLGVERFGVAGVIAISWLIALFEYLFMIPANRIGFVGTGGPFTLFQLKIIQEAINLVVFTIIAVAVFKSQHLAWNHAVGFVLLLAAVYFFFRS
ncbi:MAG: membrane protein [Candidatus Kapaibacterium sp.]|nr:MAG: membrane protein [Candidatus Kapabacteria bacterium]